MILHVFSDSKSFAALSHHTSCLLLPVQRYEAAFELLMFVYLWRKQKRGTGGYAMLCTYLGLYSVARFLLEFLRGDAERGFILGLSTSQLLALVTLTVAVALKLRAGNRGETAA